MVLKELVHSCINLAFCPTISRWCFPVDITVKAGVEGADEEMNSQVSVGREPYIHDR